MLNVSIAQINTVVGDTEGNLEKIFDVLKEVNGFSHIVIFPELVISGYMPEDLLLRHDFLQECRHAIGRLREESNKLSPLIVVGTPLYEEDIYNTLLLIHRGEIKGVYRKHFLPNYSVFDEKRYFNRGKDLLLASINGCLTGFSICEDIWHPDKVERGASLRGAKFIVNINASPFYSGKYKFKENFIKARAQDNICYVAYVNMVGGHEELIFDGRSIIVDPEGELVFRAKAFEEDISTVTLDIGKAERKRLIDLRLRDASIPENSCSIKDIRVERVKGFFESKIEHSPIGNEELYEAIKLATKDYIIKTGFRKAVIGLSGGIDSSLTACIVADAIGSDNITGVFMPSRFSSEESHEDAKKVAENLGIYFNVIPIDACFETFLEEFKKELGDLPFDSADENIQARIRANILFYMSNKFDWIVIATSNKSEIAVGYTTIYGDMAGGFAPLKDVYKTQVYELARYRNTLSDIIPERIFKKAPSAELRPNQTDQDTLPPYEELDKVLKAYIEESLSAKEIVNMGFREEIVRKIISMIKSSEYKRKQAPIGPKITPRAFGKDWRMPIINKFRG